MTDSMRTVFLVFCLSVAWPASTATAQWPGFRGGMLRDATSSEVGLLQNWPDGGPPLVWKRDGLGDAAATLAVVDGVIYTAGSIECRAYLHALRLSDGEQIWRTEIAGAGTVTPTPMIETGKVYIQLKGRVHCHDAEDGKQLWSAEVIKLVDGDKTWKDRTHYGSWHGSPIVADGKVFVVTGHPEGPLIALDQNSGKKLWQCKGQREAANRGWSSPIFVRRGSTKLVIAQTAWHVLGIDADDGTVYWEQHILGPGKNYDVGNALCNIPVYVDGRLFCTTGYGPVVWTTFDLAADGKSVKKVWNNPAIRPFQESNVCIDGMLFGTGDVTWDDFDANPDLLVNGKPLRDWPNQKQPPPPDRRHDERKKRIFHFYDREAGGRDRAGLVCQELKTGKVLGVRYGFPRIGFSGLMMAVADGRIYGVWSDICYEFWLIEPTPSMQVRGSFRIPEPDERLEDEPLIAIAHGRYSAPVIADGKLLLRIRDRLCVYDICSKK